MLVPVKKRYPMHWVNLYRPRQNRGTILRIRKESHLKNSRTNKTNPKNRMILKNGRTNHQTHRLTSLRLVRNQNRSPKNHLIWGWVLGQQRLMGLFIIKWRFGRNYPLGNWASDLIWSCILTTKEVSGKTNGMRLPILLINFYSFGGVKNQTHSGLNGAP